MHHLSSPVQGRCLLTWSALPPADPTSAQLCESERHCSPEGTCLKRNISGPAGHRHRIARKGREFVSQGWSQHPPAVPEGEPGNHCLKRVDSLLALLFLLYDFHCCSVVITRWAEHPLCSALGQVASYSVSKHPLLPVLPPSPGPLP